MHKLHPLTEKTLYMAFLRSDVIKHSKLLLHAIRTTNVALAEVTAEHPLQDDWTDFARTALSCYLAHAKGFVYVLTSAQYPETVKVGMTSLQPAQRVRRLNNESMIWGFRCESAETTHDRRYVEAKVHRLLKGNNTVYQKEFFRCTPSEAEALIKAVHQQDAELLLRQVPGLTFPL